MNTAEAVRDVFTSPNECDSNGEAANIVDAIGGGLRNVANALRTIAHGDASGPDGLEGAAMCIKEGLDGISSSLASLADAHGDVSSALFAIARALEKSTP